MKENNCWNASNSSVLWTRFDACAAVKWSSIEAVKSEKEIWNLLDFKVYESWENFLTFHNRVKVVCRTKIMDIKGDPSPTITQNRREN